MNNVNSVFLNYLDEGLCHVGNARAVSLTGSCTVISDLSDSAICFPSRYMSSQIAPQTQSKSFLPKLPDLRTEKPSDIVVSIVDMFAGINQPSSNET